MNDMPSWDQRMGRFLARRLARTPITPNHISFASLLVAVIGTGLFATGEQTLANWGAVSFVLGRLLDNVDGSLARLTGQATRFGYYFDYLVGTISYVALFACLGIGFRESLLGEWSLTLGVAGAVSALAITFVSISIDCYNEGVAIRYPSFAGFELQDGIYLTIPITWLGWLMPFFAAASIATCCYLFWTLWLLRQARRESASYEDDLDTSHASRVGESANKQRP